MLTLTRKSDYAIRIISFLASSPSKNFISSSVISQSTQVPKKFLARIILDLIKAGWVESARGSKGGVRLSKAAETVTLAQVIEKIEGPIFLNVCCQPGETCPLKGECKMHPSWMRIQLEVVKLLDSFVIVQVARQKPK